MPREGGALLALNHVSYVDFVLGGFATQDSDRLVRFMAKRELFDHRLAGPLMRSLHHISVDRGDGLASYGQGIDYLRRGEVVGIFPEATISRSFELKEFKTGATRMAAEAGVPLVPAILWGTQRMKTKSHPQDFSRGKTIAITVGEPLHPTGENSVAETAELKADDGPAARRDDPGLPGRRAAARLLVAARVVRRQRTDHGGGGACSTPRRSASAPGPAPPSARRSSPDVRRPRGGDPARARGAGRGRRRAGAAATRTRVTAVSVEVRRPPSSRARSPRTAPGPTSPSTWPSTSTETTPSSTRNSSSPGSPCRVSVSPARMRRTSGT